MEAFLKQWQLGNKMHTYKLLHIVKENYGEPQLALKSFLFY